MSTDISPYAFIRHAIIQAFIDLAEIESDDPPEGLPLELFKAQEYLLKAWDKYAGEKAKI